MKPDSDFYGMTPLIMNASQKDDCAEVAELLIHAGADLGAVDAQGRTALDCAIEGGHHQVEAILRGVR
jgi:ankyrin repeat protein